MVVMIKITKMNEKMENNTELRSKLEKFMAAKIPVHIILKRKDWSKDDNFSPFLNGYIVGKKSEDIYIIDERVVGETYVLIEDIYDVRVFQNNRRVLTDKFIKDNDVSLGEGVMKEEIDIIKEFKQTQKDIKTKEEDKTSYG
jgi:hypothetical protein